MLEGRGMILDVAREVCEVMRRAGVEGAVIGGVAVVLHGHLRTTADVVVFIAGAPEPLADALRSAGFLFEPQRKEFSKAGVPVHLVLMDQLRQAPRELVELDGVVTVSLADLIDMKLRSGLSNLLRAQDLADVIGLMRRHGLRGDFAPQLGKDVRSEFHKLVDAMADS